MRGLNTLSSEPDGDAADFLDRPTDQWRCDGVLAFFGVRRFVFLGGGGLVRWRIAAIMAKASITRETWRWPSTATSISIDVPTGHQVVKKARSPSAMWRRISRPRVHRP